MFKDWEEFWGLKIWYYETVYFKIIFIKGNDEGDQVM